MKFFSCAYPYPTPFKLPFIKSYPWNSVIKWKSRHFIAITVMTWNSSKNNSSGSYKKLCEKLTFLAEDWEILSFSENFAYILNEWSYTLFQNLGCNFIKKETLGQVFSCEFCEISKYSEREKIDWITWWNGFSFFNFRLLCGANLLPAWKKAIVQWETRSSYQWQKKSYGGVL